MSKANAKQQQQTPAAQAAQEAAPQPQTASTAAPAADQPGPVVQPAPPDEHTGKGGLYVRVGGVRQLVERTKQTAEVPQTVTATAKE